MLLPIHSILGLKNVASISGYVSANCVQLFWHIAKLLFSDHLMPTTCKLDPCQQTWARWNCDECSASRWMTSRGGPNCFQNFESFGNFRLCGFVASSAVADIHSSPEKLQCFAFTTYGFLELEAKTLNWPFRRSENKWHGNKTCDKLIYNLWKSRVPRSIQNTLKKLMHAEPTSVTQR